MLNIFLTITFSDNSYSFYRPRCPFLNFLLYSLLIMHISTFLFSFFLIFILC